MNERENCIVVYDKTRKRYTDISKDVAKIEWAGNETYRVQFYNGKEYKYYSSNIRWLQYPVRISLEDDLLFSRKRQLTNIAELLLFTDPDGKNQIKKWYKVFFENGTSAFYPDGMLQFVKNKVNEEEARNYLSYLNRVAETIKEDGDQDATFIMNELSKIVLPENSVLYKVIANRPIRQWSIKGDIIFPFNSNASQAIAVENALLYDISCIQGPPGTGKTQTILNILANLLVRDYKVAIVAGNNEATRNVMEKLEQAGLGGIDAYLGNQDNIRAFFNNICSIPKFDVDRDHDGREELKRRAPLVMEFYHRTQRKAELIHLISEYEIEKEVNDHRFAQKKIDTGYWQSFWTGNADENLQLHAYLDALMQRGRVGFVHRLALRLKYKLHHVGKVLKDVNAFTDYLQHSFYPKKLAELREELKTVESFLDDRQNKYNAERYNALSMVVLKAHLQKYYENTEHQRGTEIDYIRDFATFSRRYPVIYSTTHSLRACGKGHLFDYVIMDESSQVDLLSATIAMACAKNIVFIGDLKQLPHIVPSKFVEPLKEVFRQYRLAEYQNYAKYSILQSINLQYREQLPNVLLNEHYRCDPHIIEFCNKRFYGGKLVVHKVHKEGGGIKIRETPPHHEQGRTNKAQVRDITDEIVPNTGTKSLGIIAPFRNQVELLRSKISDEGVLIDTIHRFQGRERDTIILSTVADKITIYEDEEREDFLNNENLLNVAISRAKDVLYVLASPELLSQKGSVIHDLKKYVSYYCEEGNIEESKVYSVFDVMYQSYFPVLEKFKRRLLSISQYQSENIVGTLIDDVCKEGTGGVLGYLHTYPLRNIINADMVSDEEDRRFVLHECTHCDFVIHDMLDKRVCLVVEVDGDQHRDIVQRRRDERKDRLLKEVGIPVIRIDTKSMYTEDELRQAIREALK